MIKHESQYTLKRPVYFQGVGIHTGKECRGVIIPASVNTGITFTRMDFNEKLEIPARLEWVSSGLLATALQLECGPRVSTVEHLLAALYGFGIDNARVFLHGPEVPAMDGSAYPFIQSLQMAGKEDQQFPRQYIQIREKIKLKNISIEPFDGFRVDYGIRYDDRAIGFQQYLMDVTPDRFIQEIAKARTFGYIEDLKDLRENGLSLGANEDNVIAVSRNENRILNGALRFPEEMARHKILDLVGDFALLGRRVLGYVKAWKAGHRDHNELLRAIMYLGNYAYFKFPV